MTYVLSFLRICIPIQNTATDLRFFKYSVRKETLGAGSKSYRKISRRPWLRSFLPKPFIFQNIEPMVASTAGRQTTVKAVSRRRRGPKARLYSVCRPVTIGAED